MSANHNIALLGFGTVGQGVYEIINEAKKEYFSSLGLQITTILDLRVEEVSARVGDRCTVTKDFETIANNPNIKTVLSVLGAGNVEYDFIKRALASGKNVVTANKEIISLHMDELLSIAKENNVKLMFEAAVGGGIPIISSMIDAITINNISRIQGILNGTTNYILTKMTKMKRSFADVLAEAQKLGFAEADPTADIEGFDVMRKISILSSIAFKTMVKPEDVHLRGISRISAEDITTAEENGYCIKFIGQGLSDNSGFSVSVTPVLVAKDMVVSNVNEEYNIIVIEGDIIGKLCFMGKGAGRRATADAVASDILKIHAHDVRYETISLDANLPCRGLDGIENEYYLRVNVKNSSEFDLATDLISSLVKKNRFTYSKGKIFVFTENIPSVSMMKLYNRLSEFSEEVFYARIEKELI